MASRKKDFETPSKWSKLPKNWSYDTKLFDISFSPLPKEFKDYSIKKPDDILKAYKKGFLVKISDNDHSEICTEIDENLGWRIVRSYFNTKYKPDLISLEYHNVYKTYEEALGIVKSHELALKEQSEMSGYDWAVKEIDKNLNAWAVIYGISDKTKLKYREWLLRLDNVENVETRIYSKYIQWKYFDNKRWKNIEL